MKKEKDQRKGRNTELNIILIPVGCRQARRRIFGCSLLEVQDRKKLEGKTSGNDDNLRDIDHPFKSPLAEAAVASTEGFVIY